MTFGWRHLQICLHAVQCVAANKRSSDKLMPGVPFPFSLMNVWWGTSQKCGLCKSCVASCYLRQYHHLFWLRYYTDVTTLCKIWIVVWSHSPSACMSNSDDGAWTRKARKAGNKQKCRSYLQTTHHKWVVRFHTIFSSFRVSLSMTPLQSSTNWLFRVSFTDLTKPVAHNHS